MESTTTHARLFTGNDEIHEASLASTQPNNTAGNYLPGTRTRPNLPRRMEQPTLARKHPKTRLKPQWVNQAEAMLATQSGPHARRAVTTIRYGRMFHHHPHPCFYPHPHPNSHPHPLPLPPPPPPLLPPEAKSGEVTPPLQTLEFCPSCFSRAWRLTSKKI